MIGNRITDNALTADNGAELIERALREIEQKTGWRALEKEHLFSGVYYDSQKVGSLILKSTNQTGEKAVLKLQLRPIAFDEGFIIRYIEERNRSKIIRFPKLFRDQAWNKEDGYGYVIFEDLSQFRNLWESDLPSDEDRERHGLFLKEFIQQVLPMDSWLPISKGSVNEAYEQAFGHFFEIAQASRHHHIEQSEVDDFRDQYLRMLNMIHFDPVHFTHGHLSGKDVKWDQTNNSFVLLANLYWSYRTTYQEITFPLWVDIMHIRDVNVTVKDLQDRVNKWLVIGRETYGRDISNEPQFWMNLLERCMMTIMLDLGSSEWKKGEIQEKQSLLNAWKELFHWIAKEKLNR